ncbi:aldehyde reductase [Stemphylium lycopersici]|uniref:Aldehyde reductase n=1 Tax=Stemphylium lycopersici TaxID=183478 RepID=A0A364MUR6_STELY|nr:aldehyde reductase [Stemphylium lycopersici]RAQ99289.1 aldehyde reductase [Stemphylium lycopersici]RAR04288.1 aldehyde reductase [Stemphylium lycopersici]
MLQQFEPAAVIPAGSLILVTGANGYLGCRFSNTLIQQGYKVRGVVRDLERCEHVKAFFGKRYGNDGRFEMVQVPDLTADGAFDAAVKGCAGFVHFAVDNSFVPDPEVVVKGSIALTMRALEAAANEPGLKRFVLTSSYITACQYRMGEVYQVTQDTWNDDFVTKAWALPPDAPDRSLCTYGAAKVECEKAMWNFVKEKKPNFVANAVLPDFVTGASMPHAKPNVGPMSFALEALWSGGESWKFLGPQWMIDAEDTSLLHLGALLHPEYQGERIFGCAHRKNWTDWITRLRKMYPNHQFPDPPKEEGENMEKIVNQPRAEALLQWAGKAGFRPMEESIKEVFDTMA